MTNKTKGLQLTDVARHPLPGLVTPSSIKFSPDGAWLTYLFSQEGNLANSLIAMNIESGEKRVLADPNAGGLTEENVSLEEELRRERLRQRGTGITNYIWARGENKILLPLSGDLFILDSMGSQLSRLVEGNGQAILDPRFSPDGEWVSYVQDAELYIVSAGGGEPRQLTSGARGTGKTNGLAEYIAQEEMARRRGYWWSPDSSMIAFTEVDETHIPVYRIMHQGKAQTGAAAQEDHRYPFAGTENAKVRLGVVALADGEITWMQSTFDKYEYLCRVNWFTDGKLTAQFENREQTLLDLLEFDPRDASSQLLLREESDIWVNLHDDFYALPMNGELNGFIWASERDGFKHLYLYDRAGELQKQLTSGEWMVDSLLGVDAKAKKLYFKATKDAATEAHLYMLSLDSGQIERLTDTPGMHTPSLSADMKYYVDIHHSGSCSPSVKLYSLEDGDLKQTIFAEIDERIQAMGIQAPQLVEFDNREGVKLHAALYHPPAELGEGPFPAIISVYGGPHAQRVTNGWMMTVDLRAQHLASQGYLVFKVDNRGSARRGLQFEGVIKHNTYACEIADQVDGVKYLVEQGLADPLRVGIFGWSYGGSMSINAILREPDVFKSAVVGAPVTDWRGYDTHYTERYMGTPQNNPEGYQATTAMEYIDDLKGEVLLVHGMIDENVHFRHTARLINAFHAADKEYELIVFPNSRHMPRNPHDLHYLEKHIVAFFDKHLKA